MATRIVCKYISLDLIEEAFTLGEYTNGVPEISSIGYKISIDGDNTLIEFPDSFDFCNLVFLILDIIEVSKHGDFDVKGYVNTDPHNKITEYLKGERVCLYIEEDVKKAVQETLDNHLEILDIVTESNNNYCINSYNMFSYDSEDSTPYNERELDDYSFVQVKEGFYLYSDDDYEAEYLEDLENSKPNA